MPLNKSDWIILILRQAPLDRMRIMKILFLIWKRSKSGIKGYFNFEPYLYGPCSFELYSELRSLLNQGLITQSPHPVQEWANYYLTSNGKERAEELNKTASQKIIELVEKTAEELSHLSFYNLLKKVYQESPEFAVNSVLKGVLKI